MISMLKKSVKINNKGMITLPSALRKKYNLSPGDEVAVYDLNGQITIIPILDLKDVQSYNREYFGKIYEDIHEEEVNLEL